MKRRDLLKTLTAMTAVPVGSLIVGKHTLGGLQAEEVPVSHVSPGEYFLFFDPSAIDPDHLTEAMLPPGMSSITVHCIPVHPVNGKSVPELVAMYKVGDQVKEVKNG